ncbi:MAG: hypothetical protein HY684_05230 [Chloroflexi bacterium]|nr:hypothetical protein [Chloroflexota bacterium]
MQFPGKPLAVSLTLVGLLAGACTASAPAPPAVPAPAQTQAEQVKYGKHAEEAKGHLAVALASYQTGDMAHAKLHAGHPPSENLEVLEAPLKSRDPARAPSLRQSLQAPLQALEGQPSMATFEATITAASERLDAALRAVVPAQIPGSASFRTAVVLELLEAVAEEYAEAVEGGRLTSVEEYQDAYGFYVRARSLYGDLEGDLKARDPQAHEEVQEALNNLARALPGLAPPASPIPVSQVQSWIEGLSRELASATGVPLKKSDPRSEVAAIKGYLARILTAYEKGDAAHATQLAAEMYLDHYEKIEWRIIEKAPKLNGTLEPLLASKIRARIKAGAPATDLAALVKEAQAGLDEAEKVLAAQ